MKPRSSHFTSSSDNGNSQVRRRSSYHASKRSGSVGKERPLDAKRHKATKQQHSRRPSKRYVETDAPTVTPTSGRTTTVPTPMELEPEFGKLDPTDPVHYKRIQQRRKAIAKGKNTAGYDEYIKQIPKEKRRPRSMETPATPDPTLDIPAKRWQGLVRAWRVALHKYDPPDLVNSFSETSISREETSSLSAVPGPSGVNANATPGLLPPETPVQARQLEEAAAKGLLVDLGGAEPGAVNSSSGGGTSPSRRQINDDSSPISVWTVHSPDGGDGTHPDDFATAAAATTGGGGKKALHWADDCESDSDDDDDLL